MVSMIKSWVENLAKSHNISTILDTKPVWPQVETVEVVDLLVDISTAMSCMGSKTADTSSGNKHPPKHVRAQP